MTGKQRLRQRRDAMRRFRERNPTDAGDRSKARKKREPVKQMLAHAKYRSRRDGRPFDITADDFILPTHCPILGLKLRYGGGAGRLPNSPSLDRIDSSKGYVRGNVWVISYRANVLKRDATLEELELLVKALRRRK